MSLREIEDLPRFIIGTYSSIDCVGGIFRRKTGRTIKRGSHSKQGLTIVKKME